MNISTGQLAQIVAQSVQAAKAGGTLELKIGTIVNATLLNMLGPSDALIQIGAYKLQAKLDAPLQPGVQVALLVTGEQKNGAMELKMVGTAAKGTGAGQLTLDVQGLLKALNLPEQNNSKVLLQEFISRQLPLQQDVLQAASEVLTQLPHPTQAQVETLGKMAELGIPIQPGTFAAMDALDNGPPLHELLSNVAATLQDVLQAQGDASVGAGTVDNGTGVAGSNVTGSSAALDSLPEGTNTQPPLGSASALDVASDSQANSHASSQSSPAAQGPTSTAGNMANGDRFPENKISRLAPTGADNAHSMLKNDTKQTLAQLSNVLQDLLSDNGAMQDLGNKVKRLGLTFEAQIGQTVRRLPPGSDAATVHAALHAVAHANEETGPNLKQALLQVHETAAELHATGLEQLAQDVNDLLQNVTGQQMMQTPGQQRTDLIYQFAAVPTQVGGREQTVELHVMSRKGPNQKTLDPSNCYVLFHLDMPNLGALDIHLHIVDKVVGVRFVEEGTDQVQITPDDQRELWKAIQGVGFHLGTLKVEQKKLPADGTKSPLLPSVLTQGALDVRM